MRLVQFFMRTVFGLSLLYTQSAYTSSARVTPAAPETVVLDMPITRKELVYATSTWVPAEHASGVTCAICLEDFRRGDNVIIARCHEGHSLHAECALTQFSQRAEIQEMLCSHCRRHFQAAPLTAAEHTRRDRKFCCEFLCSCCFFIVMVDAIVLVALR